MRPIILSVASVCAILTPSVASTLAQANLLAESAVSSVWLTNEYCEMCGCPAEAIVERGFDVVLPHAVGQRSSKARPAVHAAACPPQWLPVFLAVSETDVPPASPPPLLAPTPPMLPPPSPPSPPLLPPPSCFYMMPNTNTQCVPGTHTETTIEARPALHSFHEAYGGGYATQDSNPGLADRVPGRTWSRGRTWRRGCTGLLLTRLGLALDRRCTTAQTLASAWSGER